MGGLQIIFQDPAQAVLIRRLKGLQNEKGFSMLFITHDLHLARKIADRVYVLDKGTITAQGAGFEIFGTFENQVLSTLANMHSVPSHGALRLSKRAALKALDHIHDPGHHG